MSWCVPFRFATNAFRGSQEPSRAKVPDTFRALSSRALRFTARAVLAAECPRLPVFEALSSTITPGPPRLRGARNVAHVVRALFAAHSLARPAAMEITGGCHVVAGPRRD